MFPSSCSCPSAIGANATARSNVAVEGESRPKTFRRVVEVTSPPPALGSAMATGARGSSFACPWASGGQLRRNVSLVGMASRSQSSMEREKSRRTRGMQSNRMPALDRYRRPGSLDVGSRKSRGFGEIKETTRAGVLGSCWGCDAIFVVVAFGRILECLLSSAVRTPAEAMNEGSPLAIVVQCRCWRGSFRSWALAVPSPLLSRNTDDQDIFSTPLPELEVLLLQYPTTKAMTF